MTLGLEEIVILVVVAFIVLGTFGFFNEIYAAVVSQKDDGSIANFERFYANLKELIDSKSNRDYKIGNYFIGSDKILVGFDTKWSDKAEIVPGTLKIFGGYNLYKPFKCGSGACLCLYESKLSTDSAKRDANVISCRSESFFGKNVVFLSEGGNVEPKTKGLPRADSKGNYLVFYGKDWKVQEIYIEKFFDGGKTYIYVSKIDTTKSDDPANVRKKAIDSSIKK